MSSVARQQRLAFSVSAIFSRKPERPTQPVQKKVAADITADLPVLFRWRKRKLQQISRTCKHSATQAHTKCSAFE